MARKFKQRTRVLNANELHYLANALRLRHTQLGVLRGLATIQNPMNIDAKQELDTIETVLSGLIRVRVTNKWEIF
jgi:hypothetical protein